MRFFYTLLFFVLLPLMFLRLWRKGAALPTYRRRWKERIGKVPKRNSEKTLIWFHTVSVGEFIGATPLIKHYLASDKYDILVTTMTPTGSDRVLSTFKQDVYHYYLPYDFPLFVRRFLDALSPSIFICLETELWPNLIHACYRKGVPMVLANARLSEKSAKGYRRFRALTRPMLERISLSAVQNKEDAQRLISLGLSNSRANITGNIKFDLTLHDNAVKNAATLKSDLSENNEYKIWIAASTHEGEDQPILDAFVELKKSHKKLKLMLVPRHPERFTSVFKQCQRTGLKCARRSESNSNQIDILLCDTMGELLMLYGAADMAFVGGSLVENGGHNYIEPAAWGLPIVSGPSTFNFRETAAELIEAKALDIAKSSQELVKIIQTLLDDENTARKKGDAAKFIAENNRGALQKLIGLIDTEIDALER